MIMGALGIQDSYGRGVGKPRDLCPEGTIKKLSWCYNKCKPGFRLTDQGKCVMVCPDGFRDDPETCYKQDGYNSKKATKVCPHGYSKVGALVRCYENCKDGYYHRNLDGRCVTKCPDGFKDIGTHCEKTGGYHPDSTKKLTGYDRKGYTFRSNCENDHGTCVKRGVMWYPRCASGYENHPDILWRCRPVQSCPDGYTYIQGLSPACYKTCKTGFYNRKLDGKCVQTCPPGTKDVGGTTCEKTGGYMPATKSKICPANATMKGEICYENCGPGFRLTSLGRCTRICPAGTNESSDASYCAKTGGYRPGQVKKVCPDGTELDADGLCYPPCKPDYKPVGPVCWELTEKFMDGPMFTKTKGDTFFGAGLAFAS